MPRIYHLVTRKEWEQAPAGPYQPASLAVEGFIHCSHAPQVAAAANRFYADEPDLLVLCLDAGRLGARVVEEPASTGELFPHVYGPIEREAIVHVRRLLRGPDQRWVFADGEETAPS